jgi:hypothetical protein
MARRKRTSRSPIAAGALILIALAAAAAIGYRYVDQLNRQARESGRQKILVKVPAERVSAANEGLHVQLAGRLEAAANARDGDLGIAAPAAVLLRKVEMYQWRERCDAAAECSYEPSWSSQPIDSRRFRQPGGHENPPMRLADAHFAAAELRLGAFTIDSDLVAAQVEAVDHAVHASELPPNLAASFADANGSLYAGGDAAHPRVGEVRVSYRIAPLGNVVLSGVQRGDRLAAQ